MVVTVGLVVSTVAEEIGTESFLMNQKDGESNWGSMLGRGYTAFMQLSNDHSGQDNAGYGDLVKMLISCVISAVLCLSIILSVQGVLSIVPLT